MTISQEEYVFEYSGGALCLDLANTITDRDQATPSEHLHDYADLVSWGKQAGIVLQESADGLLAEAARRPAEAQVVFERALALREAIFRIFTRRAVALPAGGADLAVLNRELALAMARARLATRAGGFAWEWEDDPRALDRLLWPVARSAAELLTSETLDRVRECGAADCDWLFLDTSKNRSRRWCDMSSCGNRAKARRHYERSRTATGKTT